MFSRLHASSTDLNTPFICAAATEIEFIFIWNVIDFQKILKVVTFFQRSKVSIALVSHLLTSYCLERASFKFFTRITFINYFYKINIENFKRNCFLNLKF